MASASASRWWRRAAEPHFFDAEYAIPAALVKGKQKVTVRFQATNGNEIAAVFGIRMIRRRPDPLTLAGRFNASPGPVPCRSSFARDEWR